MSDTGGCFLKVGCLECGEGSDSGMEIPALPGRYYGECPKGHSISVEVGIRIEDERLLLHWKRVKGSQLFSTNRMCAGS